ncbi:type II toxin-antitoxin system HicA family toxin [Paenibacillus chitinolyticus]
MGKQITVRKALQRLKDEGFIKSSSHTGKSSHHRYIHKDDPSRYADISVHTQGQVIPLGTLKNIERTSGVKF